MASDRNKIISAVSYIPFLFWLPFAADADDDFGRFHANQALALTIFIAVFLILHAFFVALTHYIGSAFDILMIIVYVSEALLCILFLAGAIGALSNKKLRLPIMGTLKFFKPYKPHVVKFDKPSKRVVSLEKASKSTDSTATKKSKKKRAKDLTQEEMDKYI